jgi:hypothetical protein
MCGCSLWNLLYVILVPRIFEVAPRFFENLCTLALGFDANLLVSLESTKRWAHSQDILVFSLLGKV